ncbi:DUF2797 domain-containing protein [Litorilituus sediminis]|uniref:DUF2797 domain-containing protein n=1 Tax=Litorilituus sediminis TaxID=718192 RepID=A0A4P6P636_9GAMM|nr:DUF2797 domain-containing protein [Litorilituus sediminis]QBG36934.1 DUF2797 domain-containing protein [Litorilituus sediminis]
MFVSEVGSIEKLVAKLDETNQVQYQLPLAAINEGQQKQLIALNPLIGKQLSLHFTGTIACKHCGKKTKKSYSQGFCYPCMTKLAQCDMCIMKPETCHHHLGTCREPEWGQKHCMIDHFVYLANSSGLKVGITRHSQVPTRWIDQGATQALPIFKVSTRLQSGLVEVALAEFINDKTNWRAMLKGVAEPIDLKAQAERLKPEIATKLAELKLTYGEDAFVELDEPVTEINYPVEQYLTKISSYNFDKTALVSGVLLGIKGQYLIFDNGVINMRKFSSYQISVEY